MNKIHLTIWNEFRHEKQVPEVQALYPDGIHQTLAKALLRDDLEIRTATLDEPEHGLRQEVLDTTDVLIWWGHMAHDEVCDTIVDRVQARVLEGMGLIALHSAHYSKIFRRLMGTTCSLKWRAANDRERFWNVMPSHPICAGIGDYFELEAEEMYGEPFGIPTPDELLFISWFTGGEVFRSGATWYRGNGRVFYFRPGHETYPSYHNDPVIRVIQNAVRWARPTLMQTLDNVESAPIEPLCDRP
jgi:trehalose utilization protein